MYFHNFYIKMYMHVFCMASVLHHTSFLTTMLAFKLRGLQYLHAGGIVAANKPEVQRVLCEERAQIGR